MEFAHVLLIDKCAPLGDYHRETNDLSKLSNDVDKCRMPYQ